MSTPPVRPKPLSRGVESLPLTPVATSDNVADPLRCVNVRTSSPSDSVDGTFGRTPTDCHSPMRHAEAGDTERREA